MSSSWPLPQDYNEAVQIPAASFSDPALKAGEAVVGARGLPLPRSGNFADVYQFRGADGKDWAVKCFTRPVVGLDRRYQAISDAVAKAALPFTVGFQFLSEGLRVNGQWYPVLKMDWVEGFLLNQFVRDNATKPGVLDAVLKMWVKLCKRLRDSGIAHADLQHGNVLLVPGAKAGSFGLKLIDYDGMYAPALANTPSGESGHAAYQHPARGRTGAYSPDLDRFPHLVIATALRGLAVGGKDLWDKYDTGDNMLFVEDDFHAPAKSKVMRDLWKTGDPALRVLVGNLALACGRPIPRTPWLDLLAPDGAPAWLDPTDMKEAADAIGISGTGTATVRALPTHAVVNLDAEMVEVEVVAAEPPRPAPAAYYAPPPPPPNAFEEVAEAADSPRRRRRPPAKSGGFPLIPVVIGAGVLVIGGLVGVVALATGKRTPVAQVTTPDDGGGTKPTTPSTRPDPDNPPKPPDNPPTPPDNPPKPPDNPPTPPDNPPKPPEVVSANMPLLRQKWTAPAPANLSSVVFSPDGGTVFAGSGALRVPTFSAAAGTPGTELTRARGQQRLTDFYPIAGSRVAFPGEAGLELLLVFDAAQGKIADRLTAPQLPEFTPPPMSQRGPDVYAASPDGRFVVAARGGATRVEEGRATVTPAPFRLVDNTTKKEVLAFDWAGGLVRFTPDSSRLVVAENGTKVRWYKLPTGEEDAAAKWEIPGMPARADGVKAISADGTRMLYTGPWFGGGGGLAVVDGKTGQPVRKLMIPGYHTGGPSLSADGRFVSLAGVENKPAGPRRVYADVYEVDSFAPVGRAVLAEDLGISLPDTWLSPDGRTLVGYRMRPQPELVAFDLGTPGAVAVLPKPPDPVTPVKTPDPPPVVKIDPKTPLVITAPADAPPPLKTKWTLPAEPNGFAQFAFTADGKKAFVTTGNRTYTAVPVFDADTGKPGPPLVRPIGRGGMTDLVPFRAGLVAVSGRNSDDPLTVWDVPGGRPTGSLARPQLPAIPPGESAPSATVRVSPDGRYVVAARRYRSVRDPATNTSTQEPGAFRLLDTTTRKELLAFDWMGAEARFTADSTRLVVAETSGRVRWYTLPAARVEREWTIPGMSRLTNHFRGMSADGKLILYTERPAAAQGGFSVVDGDTGQPVRTVNGYSPSRADLSADGRVMMLSPFSNFERVDVVETASGKPLGSVTLNEPGAREPTQVELSPDGSTLIVFRRAKNEVVAYDIPGGGGTVAMTPKTPGPKTPDPAAPKPDLAAVPDAAAVEAAEKKVREVLKDKYAKKLPADKKALATELLKLAGDSADDPPARYVMLRDAANLAAEGLDPAAAVAAVDDMAKVFQLPDPWGLKADALTRTTAATSLSTTLKAVAELAITAAEAAAGEDAFEPALKLSAAGAAAGRKANLSALAAEADARTAATRKMRDAFETVKEAQEKLKTDPADPGANLLVGKYRCFVQGRWADGLKLLAAGSDAGLKAAAEADLAAPPSGMVDTKPAEAWWDVAEKAADADKWAAQSRSRYWYNRALPGLTGLQQVAAENRLAFSVGTTEYKPGLVVKFDAKQAAVLKGKKSRVDKLVDFDGGEFTAVGGAVPLTATWTGVLVPPRAGRYKLVAVMPGKGDNVRVRVDGKTVIDTFATKVDRKDGFATLGDKPTALTVEFVGMNTGAHSVKLFWQAPGAPAEELVPAEFLYHDKKTEPPPGK